MSNIFKGQSNLTLNIDTGISLAGASVPTILYMKPDKTKGSWVGTVSGTSLTYVLSNGDIDQAGVWSFQALVTIGGKLSFGNIAIVTVYDSIQ